MLRMKGFAVYALVAGALAFSACATTSTRAPSPTAQLQPNGLSAAAVAIDGDKPIEILNSDSRAHQIYSHDCPELASEVLEPGQRFIANLGDGPKTCHFQDLLYPLAAQFHGTVEVRPTEKAPFTWSGYSSASSSSVQ